MLSLSRYSLWFFHVLPFIAPCLCVTPAFAAESKYGVLEIQIKDHREAIGDFAKFDIVLDKLLISPKAGLMFWQTGWKRITTVGRHHRSDPVHRQKNRTGISR